MYNADSDAYGYPDEDGYSNEYTDQDGNTHQYSHQTDEDAYADQDAENLDAYGNTYDCYSYSNEYAYHNCHGDGDSDAYRDFGDSYSHGYSSCGYG